MKTTLAKSAKMEPYYQVLVKEGIFDTLKDVMTFAISVGYANGNRISFKKTGGDPIKEHIFRDDMPFLDVIAVLSTKDISILLKENQDKKYTLLEEYAEGGMEIFVNEVFSEKYTNIDKIIKFVSKYEPKEKGSSTDLSSMLDSIIKNID